MQHYVEGVVGAGRCERGDGRQTWRNGFRDRELKTSAQLPGSSNTPIAACNTQPTRIAEPFRQQE